MRGMLTENIHSGVKCKILKLREPTPEEYERNTIPNVSRIIDGAMMTRQEYCLKFGEADDDWPHPLSVNPRAWKLGICPTCGEVADPPNKGKKWLKRKCKQCGPKSSHFTRKAETDTSPQRVCQWCYDCGLPYVGYTNLDGFPEPADLEQLACRFFQHNEVTE